MKEPTISTATPDQVSTTNITIKAPQMVPNVPKNTRDVCIKPLRPIKESLNNIKGNSKVTAQCVTTPLSVNVVEKAEIKELRRSCRISKRPQHYIGSCKYKLFTGTPS